MTTTTRHQEIQKLHEARNQLVKLGVPTRDIDVKIRELATPRQFETLYRRPDRTMPVQIVHVEGTQVVYVAADTQVLSGHAGNLYDEDGNQPYNTMGIP